jgi:hypothetical protein
MRVEFVPGLRRRPKKKTIDHEDKRISENTLNPLRFFPCDVYISAGFLSDDCGGYCPAQVAKPCVIIIKYLYENVGSVRTVFYCPSDVSTRPV